MNLGENAGCVFPVEFGYLRFRLVESMVEFLTKPVVSGAGYDMIPK